MTTSLAPQPVDAAAGRGSLTIADRVVERVAGHAVTLVDGASAAPRRVLGIRVGQVRPESAASVQARVHGRTATIEATIAVAWPQSVREVTQRLRNRIRAEVDHVTGVQVAHIDIDVVSLSVAEHEPQRVQ